MADSPTIVDSLSDKQFWSEQFDFVANWFYQTLSSTDTLIEIGVIAAAALIAWPIAIYLRREITKLSAQQARYAILKRFWQTLAKVVFPIVWLVLQWIAVSSMGQLGFYDGLTVVTSSLLMAWIVINMVTVFVANPLASRFIALTAWVVAALNIIGMLEATMALLDKASFTIGQVNVSVLTVIQGIITLALLLWATALVGQIIEGRIKSSPNLTPSVQVLSAKLLKIGLAVVAFILALSIVGIDLTAFAVLGGAIGLGIGFGLQKIFANLISGFILLVDKSIKPGDVITVGTDYGTVDALGARYVSVLTRDGIEHLIPNEELITTKVENWSHSNNLLRLHQMVGIHYNADVRHAIALCFEAMAETSRVLQNPAPKCHLREFADSAVNLQMRFWIDDPMNGRANVTSELLLKVWDKFHEHGIEIPYPQRDLHLRSSSINMESDFQSMHGEVSSKSPTSDS